MKRKVTITLEAEDGSLDMLTNVEIDPPVKEEEMTTVENIAIVMAGEFFDWLHEEAMESVPDDCVCSPEPMDEGCACGSKH